jgi:hypothetical protein
MIGSAGRSSLSMISLTSSYRVFAMMRKVYSIFGVKKILYQQWKRYCKSNQELSITQKILQGL